MTWGPKYSCFKLIQGLCAVGCVPTYGTLIFWSESVLQFYWKCKKCAVSFWSFSTLIFKLYWFVFIFSFFLWKMLKLVSELPLNFILFKIVYDDNHNNRSFCTKETKIILFEVFFSTDWKDLRVFFPNIIASSLWSLITFWNDIFSICLEFYFDLTDEENSYSFILKFNSSE